MKQSPLAPNKLTLDLRVVLEVLPLVLFATTLHGQGVIQSNPKKIVYGVIVDGTTSLGIASVYITTSRNKAVSDIEGNFSVELSYGDTIHVSHVSYMPYQTVFNENLDHNKFVIVLSPKVVFLKEVTVISMPTEMEFKNKILETTPQLTMEEEIAMENISILNRAAKFALPMPMDSYQSYRDYIKGPQGVVIFSSNGSKGLVKAIKNVIRATPYKFPSIFNRKAVWHKENGIGNTTQTAGNK